MYPACSLGARSSGAPEVCTWDRQLCVTCRTDTSGTDDVVMIRVRTNGMPSGCYKCAPSQRTSLTSPLASAIRTTSWFPGMFRRTQAPEAPASSRLFLAPPRKHLLPFLTYCLRLQHRVGWG